MPRPVERPMKENSHFMGRIEEQSHHLGTLASSLQEKGSPLAFPTSLSPDLESFR